MPADAWGGLIASAFVDVRPVGWNHPGNAGPETCRAFSAVLGSSSAHVHPPGAVRHHGRLALGPARLEPALGSHCRTAALPAIPGIGDGAATLGNSVSDATVFQSPAVGSAGGTQDSGKCVYRPIPRAEVQPGTEMDKRTEKVHLTIFTHVGNNQGDRQTDRAQKSNRGHPGTLGHKQGHRGKGKDKKGNAALLRDNQEQGWTNTNQK